MSKVISIFKSIFHPHENKDRKRRNDLSSENDLHHPKYRRVSNEFPERYLQRADDEIDHFQIVNDNKKPYNELLSSYLMSKQQKQHRMVNDDEFSDEDELSSIRQPVAATNSYMSSNKPSTSGFNFNRQSSQVNHFSFTQRKPFPKHDDVQFTANARKSWIRRAVPPLVPITNSLNQTPHSNISNGFSHGSKAVTQRRSILDFTRCNRAFNDSPAPPKQTSVIDKCHGEKVRIDYGNLIKKLVNYPKFTQKAPVKQFQTKSQHEPIETVDLSDDADYVNSASTAYAMNRLSNPQFRHASYKKAHEFVEVSDDEDEPSFARHPFISSTLIKAKNDRSRNISEKKSPPSFTVPEVTPINSLKEKQSSLRCLNENAIDSIVHKFKQSRILNDSKIREAATTVKLLSKDTAVHEREQQLKLDQTVSSLQKFVILDEEDEKIDEFPQLTEEMLQVIRYGLNGPRNETLVSKFNLNITRLDLNTLDGLNWLNDEVINFYMELLKQRSEEVDHLPKVHSMSTFFIPRLLSNGHMGVRRWTRKVDIFSFDIIPIPVHVGGVHWCMSVINIRDKAIRYYDSMGHPNIAVLEALKTYLEDESMDKRKIALDTSDWTIECVRDCPQQRNGSDCGVFSCMFAEFLTRDSKISFDQQHMQYFRRKMVYEIITGKLILGY